MCALGCAIVALANLARAVDWPMFCHPLHIASGFNELAVRAPPFDLPIGGRILLGLTALRVESRPYIGTANWGSFGSPVVSDVIGEEPPRPLQKWLASVKKR